MKSREFRVHSREQLQRVASLLSQMMVSEERPLLVSVGDLQQQRTAQQNRRYWAVLNELADVEIEGRRYSAETWHEYMKIRFVGAEDVVLPNGSILHRPISTTTLNVGQFFAYMDNVENEAAKYGAILEDVA